MSLRPWSIAIATCAACGGSTGDAATQDSGATMTMSTSDGSSFTGPSSGTTADDNALTSAELDTTMDTGMSDGLTGTSDDTGVAPPSGAIRFAQNGPDEHDYGQDLVLPPTFGAAEFTLEVWIVPDASFPVGPTNGGDAQLLNWSDLDLEPYSSNDWWYTGNFLLDGHNNGSFSAGTFSLQFYGGGRVRWLFGDGASDVGGQVWSIGAYPASEASSLLDDAPHLVTCVRRANGSGAALELWIDGELIDEQSTPVLADLQAMWWSDWSDFPPGQEGWFWGAEKQAAIGALSQYEDYKGLLAELRFWDIARAPADIAASSNETLGGDERGLVGLVHFDEGEGTRACDALNPARCMELYRMQRSAWVE